MTKELESLKKSVEKLESKVNSIIKKVNDIVLCLEENNLGIKTPVEFLIDDGEEESPD